MSGPTRRIATAAALTALVTLLATGTAWAQAVVTISPADGSALGTAPSAVDLTFSATPDPDSSHVVVRDGTGSTVSVGELARLGGKGLRQPVAIRTTGDFTVAYHVTFTDGSESVGVVRFSVGTGVAPPVLDDAARRAAQAPVLGHDHGVDPVGGTLLLVDVLVLGGVVVLLLRRPRPRWPIQPVDTGDHG